MFFGVNLTASLFLIGLGILICIGWLVMRRKTAYGRRQDGKQGRGPIVFWDILALLMLMGVLCWYLINLSSDYPQ